MSIKKFAKSTCSLLLAATSVAAVSLTAVGCGGADPDANKTKIYVEIKSGGTGVQWLIDAGKRFATKVGNKSYETGKEGVAIVPVPSDGVSLKNAETSGTAIFDLENEPRIANDALAGKVLCIDDVMTEKSDRRNGIAISPAEKISEDQRERYMYNGKYYGGPTCEYYPVISYDRDLFDNYNLYLANPDAIEEAEELELNLHESDILAADYYFLPTAKTNDKSLMSCGPDGEYDTDDDGLPSSLLELIALCEYMKGKGISAFNFTGGFKYYSNFLVSALYTALQGYDSARANYTFKGTFDIVTGMTDEPLFAGEDSIMAPETKTVTVTEETGYYTSWKVEKYYAEAFMELCVKYGWFGPSVNGTDDQKTAMSKFVFSDFQGAPKIAMLLDGSYWYNEATEGDNYFKMLADLKYLEADQNKPRDVRVMPLPVNLTESVEEGEGKPQTFIEMNYGMFALNKNLEKEPGLMNASKDFLSFLYTDDELSAYTASTSIWRSMNYDLNADGKDKISLYGENLQKLLRTQGNKVLYLSADNATFQKNTASFMQGWDNAVFSVSGIPSLYEAIAIEKKDGLKTTQDIFKAQAFTKKTWMNMYQGTGTVGSIDGLEALDY